MQRTASFQVICLIFTLYSPFAAAQSFQHEAQIQYSESSSSNSPDSALHGLSYRYYFSDISNSDVPLSEMAFVSQISNLGINYFQVDTENRNQAGSGNHFQQSQISGTYYHQDTGYYLGASLSNGGGSSINDREGYSINLGKYLTDSTVLDLDYSNTSDDRPPIIYSTLTPTCGWQLNGTFIVCTAPISFVPQILKTSNEIRAYRASLRHLDELFGHHIAFELNYEDETRVNTTQIINTSPYSETSASSSQKSRILGAEITAYWGRNLSLRLYYSDLNNDGPLSALDSDTYGLTLEFFVLPELSLNLGFNRTDMEARISSLAPPVLGVGTPNPASVIPTVTTYAQFRPFTSTYNYVPYSSTSFALFTNLRDVETLSLNLQWRF